MSKYTYELIFSRECIVPTLETWGHGEGDILEQESGFTLPESGYQFFVYNNGFVRNYINMQVTDEIVAYITRMMAEDKTYFDRVENKFWEYSKYLNQYFNNEKVINNRSELGKFFDIGVKWWAYYDVAYWASYFPPDKVSQALFNRAEKIRLSNNNTIFCFNDAHKKGIEKLFGENFRDEYVHLTRREIMDEKIPDDLSERKKHFIYFNHKMHFEPLEEFIAKYGISIKSFNKTQGTIKGQVAYPGGKITGKVKVCLFDRDLPVFKKGEILVTSMTMPHFLPTVKKAAAIITDEGGMTCHASIIARELKKPCIVGTRFATAVLVDGDLVEADTDKGTVKVLKKAND